MDFGNPTTGLVRETIPEEVERGYESGSGTQFHEKVIEVVREKMDNIGTGRGSVSSAYQQIPRIRSVSASTGSSCSRKNKFRLSVEMNIKPRTLSDSSGVESDECYNHEPISVVVDYPEDVVVSVNARIRKTEVDANKITADVDAQMLMAGNGSKVTEEVIDDFDYENQDQMMNSTFVKAPYTSTLIYPIMEEQENGDGELVVQSIQDKEPSRNCSLQASFRKSGESSLYKTGLDGNDAMFGDLSAIIRIGDGVEKQNLEDVVDGEDAQYNAEFKGHPSLSLNSRARMYPSEKLTPAEKLVKAFHVIARYRGAWGVFEDDQRIVSHLINLNGLLTMTDASVIEAICIDEDYRELNGLVSYFLLEKRYIIRSELIQTFKLLCNKSIDIASVILSSDIPVVLAREISGNEYSSKEIYDYAVFFLQIINVVQLTEEQCVDVGHGFYAKLVELVHEAEKNHYESIAEILFGVLLKYHQQLKDDKDLKWDCLSLSATANIYCLKKLKDKLISLIVRNGTTLSMASQGHGRVSNDKIQEMLKVLTDFMICSCTREMFTDTELDILLVTLIHLMENSSFMVNFQGDVLKTIYHILKTIGTEPSGLDRLRRVVKKVIKEWEAAGDNVVSHHWLKRICKILNNI